MQLDILGKEQPPSGLPQLGNPRPLQHNVLQGAVSATPPTAPALGPCPLYIIMNKPKGYVCSAVSDSHKTVYQLLIPELQALVKGAKRGQRLHTIGRLDAETTGLLLITTDGKFSHKITTPESKIKKKYKVILENKVSPENQETYIKKAKEGILLPAEKKSPQELITSEIIEFIEDNCCFITIKEGKFHQVRRTFSSLGNNVLELKRISIGELQLPQDLKEGEYREMTKDEIESLYFHQQY